MIMIDCYGHEASSERFQKSDFAKKPYLIAVNGNTTYVCYSKAAQRPIHRLVTNSAGTETELTWAYGTWENRTSLSYTATLNDPLMIAGENENA